MSFLAARGWSQTAPLHDIVDAMRQSGDSGGAYLAELLEQELRRYLDMIYMHHRGRLVMAERSNPGLWTFYCEKSLRFGNVFSNPLWNQLPAGVRNRPFPVLSPTEPPLTIDGFQLPARPLFRPKKRKREKELDHAVKRGRGEMSRVAWLRDECMPAWLASGSRRVHCREGGATLREYAASLRASAQGLRRWVDRRATSRTGLSMFEARHDRALEAVRGELSAYAETYMRGIDSYNEHDAAAAYFARAGEDATSDADQAAREVERLRKTAPARLVEWNEAAVSFHHARAFSRKAESLATSMREDALHLRGTNLEKRTRDSLLDAMKEVETTAGVMAKTACVAMDAAHTRMTRCDVGRAEYLSLLRAARKQDLAELVKQGNAECMALVTRVRETPRSSWPSFALTAEEMRQIWARLDVRVPHFDHWSDAAVATLVGDGVSRETCRARFEDLRLAPTRTAAGLFVSLARVFESAADSLEPDATLAEATHVPPERVPYARERPEARDVQSLVAWLAALEAKLAGAGPHAVESRHTVQMDLEYLRDEARPPPDMHWYAGRLPAWCAAVQCIGDARA